MFFLLAAFLLASLSMLRLESIKLDLPSAATAKRDFKPDILNISVKATGEVYYEKKPVNMDELQRILADAYRKNSNAPVYISGDKETKHGAIVRVLDLVRREGIQKVSFAISPAPAPSK
jgi:biopolymer transport protein ExbD